MLPDRLLLASALEPPLTVVPPAVFPPDWLPVFPPVSLAFALVPPAPELSLRLVPPLSPAPEPPVRLAPLASLPEDPADELPAVWPSLLAEPPLPPEPAL